MGTLIDSLVGIASPWLYVVVALLAAAESAALVGLVVPGEAALLVGGFAASQGRVSLPVLIAAATIAAIVGDSIGYELGRHFGPRVRVTRVGRWVGEERWARAEGFIDRRGGPAVLLGRWVGLLRALVPGVAGMTRMPYPRFLVWNVLGAVVWAPAVVSAGYFAGSSFKRVERWFGQASLLVLAVAVCGFAVWAGARWAAEHRATFTRVGVRIRESPGAQMVRRAAAPIVVRLRPTRAFVTVLSAALLVVGAAGWAFAETFDAVVGADGISRADQPVASWFDAHRTAGLTSIMRTVSTVGGGTGAIVLAVAAATLGWQRWGRRAPAVMAAAFGGSLALSQAIKHLVGRQRPTGPGAVIDGFAFPSGHTTVPVVVWGAAALIVATGQPWRRQVTAWAVAISVGALVGFSRAYLGAHWLTDVIGGWLLGTTWLACVVGADALVRHRSDLRDDDLAVAIDDETTDLIDLQSPSSSSMAVVS
ncbi:MAG: bifunctional DedA family/phosphatase PAP2 family protein [Acidimicrobiales bacterium]|nr:bifunctional DedA family/phosphatase PAP2 family protein [Acidimicrobiales bacterium]